MIYKCIGCGQEKDKTGGCGPGSIGASGGVACPGCHQQVFPKDPVNKVANKYNGIGVGFENAEKIRAHFTNKPSPAVGADAYATVARPLPSIESLAFALFRTDPRLVADIHKCLELDRCVMDSTCDNYVVNGLSVARRDVIARGNAAADKAWSSDRLGLASESRKRAEEMIAVMGAKK